MPTLQVLDVLNQQFFWGDGDSKHLLLNQCTVRKGDVLIQPTIDTSFLSLQCCSFDCFSSHLINIGQCTFTKYYCPSQNHAHENGFANVLRQNCSCCSQPREMFPFHWWPSELYSRILLVQGCHQADEYNFNVTEHFLMNSLWYEHN